MNDIMRGKIEACIELSDCDAEKFKRDVMKVTGFTEKGFNNCAVTSVAYNMLKRNESINAVINTVSVR